LASAAHITTPTTHITPKPKREPRPRSDGPHLRGAARTGVSPCVAPAVPCSEVGRIASLGLVRRPGPSCCGPRATAQAAIRRPHVRHLTSAPASEANNGARRPAPLFQPISTHKKTPKPGPADGSDVVCLSNNGVENVLRRCTCAFERESSDASTITLSALVSVFVPQAATAGAGVLSGQQERHSNT
jgi:hypothetical protein